MAMNPWTNTDLHVISVAKTSSSTCRACGHAIPADTIRIGIIFQHKSGYIGLDWHHLVCCETPENLPYVDGYELLGDKAKATVHMYMAIRESIGMWTS
ncbi:hypothetical protein AeMF1_002481 [Aphanomyces euteiches]|nr:hypothetical protein AeMF1_002481 [Aphanomyces euteiches]KAH9192669.1 hypothetical protein AeNC1_005345 [Aphanomyces euteiches]